MTIRHVQLFSSPVSDQDRAAAFSCDVFGFTVLEDQQMGPGMRWVHLGLEGAQTSITLVT
jgi:catechol 2,3-dioxygenase-like lactoylglutathione lyase family enzyme